MQWLPKFPSSLYVCFAAAILPRSNSINFFHFMTPEHPSQCQIQCRGTNQQAREYQYLNIAPRIHRKLCVPRRKPASHTHNRRAQENPGERRQNLARPQSTVPQPENNTQRIEIEIARQRRSQCWSSVLHTSEQGSLQK